ncbi:MAG: molybdenum ABC transporter ATP-binding protein [Magnetococcus sp. MYC-9]
MSLSAPQAICARIRLGYPGFSLDVELDLPGRGVIALFGPSGSGKTTVLRAMAGLERPPGGFLQVNGSIWQDDTQGVFLPPHRRPIGYVFQEATLFSHLDVRQNLVYGMERVPKMERRVSLEYTVELLGIEHLLMRKPGNLSGGERQRVAMARALMVSPTVLLLDEPLAALDLTRKREILPYLERLHDELDIPMLYVSHAPDEVARLADHIVVLDSGRVVAQGPLTETLARLDLSIQLGDDVGVLLEGVVAERDQNWHLARVRFPGGNLWVRDEGRPVGHHARVRILARDISLSLYKQEGSSILNLLYGHVTDLVGDTHPGLLLVRVQVGESPMIARVTRRSAAALGLATNKPVWVQVKSAALME